MPTESGNGDDSPLPVLLRLWQAFRDEIGWKPVAPEPPAQRRTITFAAFVAEYLEKICARRAKKEKIRFEELASSRT